MWRWAIALLVTSGCHREEAASKTQPTSSQTACTLDGPVAGRAMVSGERMVEGDMAPGDAPKPVPAEVLATAEGFADVSTSNALVAHGHPDAAWELAEQLRTRELLGLMVASAIWKSIEPERAPNPAYLFDALAMEARCGDATIGAMLDGSLDSAAGDAWLLDFGIERLKYRDHMARLLLELDPIRDDAAAQRATLAAFAEPMQHAPLAGVLTYGLHRVADDYLTPPAPLEHP